MAVNIELRFTPFSWNAGGTDESGQSAPNWVLSYDDENELFWDYPNTGTEGEYPDGVIDDNDRSWTPNASIGLGFAFYFPLTTRISE